MGRHLNTEPWMRRRTETGNWQLKRVSEAHEAQFPRVYREAWRDHGPVRVVRMLRDERNLTLAEAWDLMKAMVNNKPKSIK